MKKVLITGVAGFIGSNLAQRCLELGWEVHGVDNLSNGRQQFVPRSVQVHYDGFANGPTRLLVDREEYDTVFHLAAAARVAFSVKYPVHTNETNVQDTLSLMNTCRDRVGRFVFASSSSVYGGAKVLPTPVTELKDPKSPYALQKSVIEDYLGLYRALYGLDSISLRFFNVFGPNQLGCSQYSTAVSAWLHAAHAGRSLRFDGDGTQSRDMCYVDNVVEACVLASEVKDPKHRVLNVACNESVTNNEILGAIKQRFNNVNVEHAPWRKGDVMHTLADISHTTETLGYVPTVRFWDGFERTAEWFEENWERIKDL